MFLGGVVIWSGHICLAMPALATFYLGLVLIASGTGLLKGNISVLVGKLYAPDDMRRDAGYSLFYMGINTGAFVAPLHHRLAGPERVVQGPARLGGTLAGHLVALGIRGRGGGNVLRPGAVRAGRQVLAEDARRPIRPSDPVEAARLDRRVRVGGLAIGAAVVLLAVLLATGTLSIDPEGCRAGSSGC